MKETYSFFHVFPNGELTVATQIMSCESDEQRDKWFAIYKQSVSDTYPGNVACWQQGYKEQELRQAKEKIEELNAQLAECDEDEDDFRY